MCILMHISETAALPYMKAYMVNDFRTEPPRKLIFCELVGTPVPSIGQHIVGVGPEVCIRTSTYKSPTSKRMFIGNLNSWTGGIPVPTRRIRWTACNHREIEKSSIFEGMVEKSKFSWLKGSRRTYGAPAAFQRRTCSQGDHTFSLRRRY